MKRGRGEAQEEQQREKRDSTSEARRRKVSAARGGGRQTTFPASSPSFPPGMGGPQRGRGLWGTPQDQEAERAKKWEEYQRLKEMFQGEPVGGNGERDYRERKGGLDERCFRRVERFEGDPLKYRGWRFDFLVAVGQINQE